jgi:hypothetical protein
MDSTLEMRRRTENLKNIEWGVDASLLQTTYAYMLLFLDVKEY